MTYTNIKKFTLILISIFAINTKIAFAMHEFELHSKPKMAPSSFFQNNQGKRQTLENYRGNIIILAFWDLSCKPCLLEMPLLNRLQKKFKNKNVIILPISQNVLAMSQIRSFYRRYKLKDLNYIIDSDNFTGSSFGVKAIPTSFIINKQGQLVAQTTGLIDWLSSDNVNFIEELITQN